jgi:MinD-like ATPase involved in chromosome partitioning or flagellar assembly
MNHSEIERYRKRIIVIYSPDGGNGKSEIAANLAFCCARKGLRTWILDANLFAPTQDLIFGFDASCATLSEFLVDKNMQEIPFYPLDGCFGGCDHSNMYLTPANRTDPDLRFRLQEQMCSGDDDIYSRIPGAILQVLISQGIDMLIIDTHPGFEQINEVWLAMTDYLLIISRLNDLDMENLSVLLQDGNVADITQKLLVFNNVILNESRHPFQALENAIVHERFNRLKLNTKLSGDLESSNGCEGRVELYKEPILYSEKLAQYGETVVRNGLFVEHEPDDLFSLRIQHLADHIIEYGIGTGRKGNGDH